MTPREMQAESERSWGTRVFQRREELHLTQEQVAELAQIDRSIVSRIEANRTVPRFRTMVSIAKALGTTVDELFPMIAHPQRMRRVA